MAVVLLGQATGGTGSTAGATSATATRNTAAGSTLIAVVAVRSGATNPLTSVTDSAGNTWTQLALDYLSGSSTRQEIWGCFNAAATTSVTANHASTTTPYVFNVSEWSGVSDIDVNGPASPTGNASSTTPASRTVTTTAAGDVVIGGLSWASSSATATLGGTFTALTGLSGTNANAINVAAAYQVEASTGTYGPVWTLSGASTSGAATVALLASAAPPAPPTIHMAPINR